jgi:hypothetical protein
MRSTDATLHRAALIIIAASLLGPGWVFVDAAVRHPEPWTDAATWSAGYRWFMAVPPLLGFPLMYGFVLFVAGARRLDEQRGGRVDPVPVLLLTAIYGALVAFNYIANACYVGQASSSDLGAVSTLSMANPRSLCWAIELFAYGILGMVTWLVAPTFREERAVALLLRTNGVVSVGCAAVALFDLTWVQSPIGLGFYAAWNLLIVVLMVLVARNFRSAPGGTPSTSPETALAARPAPGRRP